MKTINYFNLAMDLSNNMFAFHLCGVLTSLNENNLPAPNPEKEALEYLKIYHSEALAEAQEDEEFEPCDDGDDEQALASAGFGMDESYGAYGGGEDFGYFGEMGMMED